MAKFWAIALATAVAVGALAGLFLPALRAAAGDAPPRALGDPGSGWISDVRVETNASAQRRPSMATHANGDLLMVYQTNELGNEDVMFTRSWNGGLNWSTPVPVADTAAAEVWPSIASDPESGRIFVAYQLGAASPTTIMVAYSDDGAAWTQVIAFSCGVLCTRPRIVSEYWNGTSNRQYVVFDAEITFGTDWDWVLIRSEDDGLSWAFLYESGNPPTPPDVRHQPDIAVYRGTDGTDRVAVFYRYGFAFPGTGGLMEWSEDHGSTLSWQGPSGWAINVNAPPVIAASHDGDSVLVAFNTAANDIWWAADQDPTDLWWGATSYAGVWLGAGNNLALAADGAGSTSLAVGGSYHLFARSVAGGDITHVSAPVNVTDQTNWTAIATASDTAGFPSVAWPDKAATTVLRGGSWWPAVTWTDFRIGVVDYELYFTTPGARYTIDTNPGLLQVLVDGTPGTAPVTATWLAGTSHTVNAVSPQTLGVGMRYSWVNWSDGGAQSHSIVAGGADATLIANFGLEYQLTLTSARGGVTGAGWYGSGESATIAASTPQSGPPGERYVFLAWIGDLFSDQPSAFVVMNAPKTVNAAWGTEYRLTITTAHGTVTQTEPDGWYADGDVATITLESREVTEGGKTWQFVRWTGDATGTTANVTVEMDGPKNATAEWREKPGLLSGSSGILVILLVLVVVLFLIIAAVAMRRRKKPQPQFQQMQPAPAYGTVPPPTEGGPPQGWPPTAPPPP